MKRQIKYGLGGLALALSCLFGAPAFAADYTGDCAGLAANFNGNGNVDITDSSCTLGSVAATGYINIPVTGAVSTGVLSGSSITISGSSVTTGGLSATSGDLSVTATSGTISGPSFDSTNGSTTLTTSNGAIIVSTVTSTNGAITITSIGGDITTTDLFAHGGTLKLDSGGNLTINGKVETDFYDIDIKAANDIDVDQLLSGWKMKVVSTAGKISADAGSATSEALKVQNYGALEVTAKTTLDVIGTVTSVFADIILKADNDVTLKKVASGNGLKVTSVTGKITVDGGSDTNDALSAANYGNVDIKADDTITITGKTVSQMYSIKVEAQNDIEADEISSGGSLKVISTSGKIDIAKDITSNTYDAGGNVLLVANETIATGSISTTGTNKTGGVEIQAHIGTTPTTFTIGGSGHTNGVNGTIDTTSTHGGGTDLAFVVGGIFVTNGAESTIGNITVDSASTVLVRATSSRSGLIYLNAWDGTITLPTGNALNSNGIGGGAGQIALLAKTITVAADSVISASHTSGTYRHGIVIAAETINFSGTAGLTLDADGDGASTAAANLLLFPKGGITITSSSAGSDYPFEYMYWFTGFITTDGPISLVGSANAPLKLTANGSDTQIAITGNGTTFTGGAVTVEAKGKTNHTINIYDTGSADSNGLTFGGTGAVIIDASGENGSGSGASGGKIYLSSDLLTFNASDHTLKANGPSSGDGDGGTVFLSSRLPTVLSPSAPFSITANGAPAGTGNAIVGDVAVFEPKAIEFYPGAIAADFGNAAGQFSLSANGGLSDGNGGTIVIAAASASLKETTPTAALAIDASAIAGDGNGGEIVIYSYIIGIETEAKVAAHGQGTGTGGKFTTYYNIPTVNFNVVKHVMVDGGLSISPTDFNGSITVNDVRCRQWIYTGDGSFPNTYWNCVDPDSPDAFDEVPALFAENIANGSTRTLMSDQVTIFVHTNNIAHNAFFNEVAPEYAPGYTFRVPPAAGIPIIVSVMQNCSNCAGHSGAYSLTPQEFKELSAHEIGHAANFATGSPPEHESSTYSNYRLRDLLNLDYSVVGATKGTSTQRPPCSPLNDGSAPFDGVKALPSPSTAPVDMCVAGAFNTGALGFPPTGTLNSTILQNFSGRITTEELYGQTFAFVAGSNSSNYLDPTADGVFEHSTNGSPYEWFSCTLTRASQIASGTGTISSVCNVAVPSWYVPLITF